MFILHTYFDRQKFYTPASEWDDIPNKPVCSIATLLSIIRSWNGETFEGSSL